MIGNDSSQRPRWKLHSLTWGAAALILASFVVLNLLAEEFNALLYQHGWPLWFAKRERLVLVDFDPVEVRGERGPWLAFPEIHYFRAIPLAVDLALMLFVTAGAAWTIERACRRLGVAPSFTLKTLLAATAWAAFYAAIERTSEIPWNTSAKDVARAICYGGVFLAWLALFDLAGLAWDKLAARRQPT